VPYARTGVTKMMSWVWQAIVLSAYNCPAQSGDVGVRRGLKAPVQEFQETGTMYLRVFP